MGEETEIIPECKKGILMHLYLALAIQVGKDAAVLPEQAMYIPNEIIRVAVKPVVVVVPALIGTEFLIGTAMDRFSTVETFLFHSTKVSIKI